MPPAGQRRRLEDFVGFPRPHPRCRSPARGWQSAPPSTRSSRGPFVNLEDDDDIGPSQWRGCDGQGCNSLAAKVELLSKDNNNDGTDYNVFYQRSTCSSFSFFSFLVKFPPYYVKKIYQISMNSLALAKFR
jgi:hypothetical protein